MVNILVLDLYILIHKSFEQVFNISLSFTGFDIVLCFVFIIFVLEMARRSSVTNNGED